MGRPSEHDVRSVAAGPDTGALPVQGLRVLHAVATAANRAGTLLELAPGVLTALCDGFGWTDGALLRWSAEDPTAPPTVLARLDRPGRRPAPGLARLRPDDPVAVGQAVVPLSPDPTGAQAWWFETGPAALGPDFREVLDLVGGETSRVVERESAARLLRESGDRFHAVFNLSPLPMGLTSGDTGTYSIVNEALCSLVGRTREELVGSSARSIIHPDDHVLADPAGAAALVDPQGRHQVEMRMVHAGGAVLTTLVTLAWIRGRGGARHLLAQIEDITARRAGEEVLRHQAEHDPLTGLANRAHLGDVLAQVGETGEECVVVFVDLDGFKVINDTRGHDVGDEVLVEVARRLRAVARHGDLVARCGGDEFVVVCRPDPNGGLPPSPTLVSSRIQATLSAPVATRGGLARVTASLGIAAGPVDSRAPQQLVQQADVAMYQAKTLGKNRSETYDWHLHRRSVEERRTETLLRHALEEDRFVVHYQPIVAVSDLSVVGYEALVRLRDHAGSLVPPGAFIGVAERSGLIIPMGSWVLAESCRAIARLRAQLGRPLSVSVNVAAAQASRPDLLATVLEALEATGLPPQALTLELTESALLEAGSSTLDQLVELRRHGVLVGLDDFGTGYSSLTYLRRLPVSYLKVDRSFVEGMVDSTSDRAIVRAVTRLATDLGLGWVAEGIETPAQLAAVAALGPGRAQGYLFGRPTAESCLSPQAPQRRPELNESA